MEPVLNWEFKRRLCNHIEIFLQEVKLVLRRGLKFSVCSHVQMCSQSVNFKLFMKWELPFHAILLMPFITLFLSESPDTSLYVIHISIRYKYPCRSIWISARLCTVSGISPTKLVFFGVHASVGRCMNINWEFGSASWLKMFLNAHIIIFCLHGLDLHHN
jgi:hypothetical protein